MPEFTVWVVSHCDDDADEVTTTVFRDKDAAASCYRFLVKSRHKRVTMVECPIIRHFDKTDATPIEVLGLSRRASLCLRRYGVHTIDELLVLDFQTLKDIRGLGVVLIAEIIERLHAQGYKTGWEKAEDE